MDYGLRVTERGEISQVFLYLSRSSLATPDACLTEISFKSSVLSNFICFFKMLFLSFFNTKKKLKETFLYFVSFYIFFIYFIAHLLSILALSADVE